MNWLTTPDGVSAIALIITLFVLVLTFQHAYRPQVGIIRIHPSYDRVNNELICTLELENTGNEPANNISTKISMYHNSEKLAYVPGKSKFLLFPKQTTNTSLFYHKVSEYKLKEDKFIIEAEIYYEQKIFTYFIKRTFLTKQTMEYDYLNGAYRFTFGEANKYKITNERSAYDLSAMSGMPFSAMNAARINQS